MYKALIFGGTTEGRVLAARLSSYGIDVTVSVATNTGRDTLPESDNIKCLVNRLTKEEMVNLIKNYEVVIDATHPYASEVTGNVKAACSTSNVEYLRLVREETPLTSCTYVNDVNEAIDYLNKVEGNILLTTGSRDLHMFSDVKGYSTRIYARVLPTVDVMEKCYSLGFKAKNIIAMQGPFSEEFNTSLLKQINAKYMVTKESGDIGGFKEKVMSAIKAEVKLIVIGRPLDETGYSLEEIINKVTKNIKVDNKEKDVNRYFPLFINLKRKKVKVFGGGNIAARRINTLLNFNCIIEVITKEAVDSIKTLRDENKIKLSLRGYIEGDCSGADLVLGATDNRYVNNLIYNECKNSNILCNISDKKEECSFYFPGIVAKDNVVVGVTASGENHKLAKEVTTKIKDIFN